MPRLTLTPRLAGRAPGEPVELSDVLGSLDRRGRRAFAPGLSVRHALTWDHADRHDEEWWPQGITSAADAGRADRHGRLLLISWYSKAGLGVRITFLDLDTRRYRHVRLALVTDDALAPLEVHAGGLLWRGPWLYIASTRRGCYLAHLDDLVRVGGEIVWPVRLHYSAKDRTRYSFLSLDREGPAMLVGEYGGPELENRLVRFPLDPSGLLALNSDGAATAVSVDIGVPSMQGAVRIDGRYHLMVSRGRRRPGDLWVGRPDGLRRRSLVTPPGPEDVTYWPDSDVLWSVTEYPGRRWVFAIRRPRSRT